MCSCSNMCILMNNLLHGCLAYHHVSCHEEDCKGQLVLIKERAASVSEQEVGKEKRETLKTFFACIRNEGQL